MNFLFVRLTRKLLGSSIIDNNRKKAYINELWIRPEFQGKGIGKKLVQFIEDKYKKRGVKKMRLVSKKSAGAFKFYNKIGYTELKDLVFMEKKLK